MQAFTHTNTHAHLHKNTAYSTYTYRHPYIHRLWYQSARHSHSAGGCWPYVSVDIHKAQARTGVGAKYGLSKLQADTPRRQLNHTTHQDTISGTLQALLLAAAAARGNDVVSHLGLVAGNISQPDREGEYTETTSGSGQILLANRPA